jgi:two-component system LytT family response regulator
MNQLKAIVVDDETTASNVLNNLLQMSNINVEVVATCNSVLEAVVAIKKLNPNVVFLDVQMSEYAGYKTVNFFDEITFEIIFVTAFDQYAIKAFELNAVDNIVKPLERNRLDEALRKAEAKWDQRDKIEKYQSLLSSILEETIGNIAIEAKWAYCNVHLLNESTFLVSRNLKYFESLLPEDAPFFRSHRSWLLNLNHVENFKPRSEEVFLTKNLIARISRSQIKGFEKNALQ